MYQEGTAKAEKAMCSMQGKLFEDRCVFSQRLLSQPFLSLKTCLGLAQPLGPSRGFGFAVCVCIVLQLQTQKV